MRMGRPGLAPPIADVLDDVMSRAYRNPCDDVEPVSFTTLEHHPWFSVTRSK